MRLQLLFLWIGAAFAAGHYPLGINLGMKYITAASLTATNESVPVAKREGSQAYKNHMAKLVEDSGIRMVLHRTVYIRSGDSYAEAPSEYHGYSASDRELIANIFKEITESAIQSVGQVPEIITASIPTGLDRIARNHLTETIMHRNAHSSVPKVLQVLEFLNAARLAYDLDTSEALGHEERFDLLDGPLNLVACVDHNAHSLDMWTADVTELAADSNDAEHAQARFPDLGADMADATEDKISQRIQQFIKGLLASDDGQHVRAVVVTGEASAAVMEVIRNTTKAALPDGKKSLLRDQIDPAFVAAVGAAQRARKLGQIPDLHHDHDHHHDAIPLYLHDEL
ncbi:hypothetical protein BDV11DRAFT_171219 [Aspergillus similis]